MENKKQKFEVGQEVKVIRYSFGTTRMLGCGTVAKVWKNGVVVVSLTDGHEMVFNPDGCERGNRHSLHRKYLRPMEDGETIKSIQAQRAEARAKAEAQHKAEVAELEKRVNEWWEAEGKQMWTDAVPCGEFNGHTIRQIKYVSRGENRMALMAFSHSKRFGQMTFAVEALGGLTAWVGSSNVNSFSSSTVTGRTMMEMLYNIVH